MSESSLKIDPIEALILTLLEDELKEAKYIGSFKGNKYDREILAAGWKAFAPDVYQQERYTKARAARESFRNLSDKFYKAGMHLIGEVQSGNMSQEEFKNRFFLVLKEAYFKSFSYGLHSSGMTEFAKYSVLSMMRDPTEPQYLQELTDAEKHFVQYAWKHETQFLQQFIMDVVMGRGKMPYPRRLRMYTDALWNIYQSGRYMGQPANTLIHWMTKKDKKVCASCEYLSLNGPYFKNNLPTMPRSGMTRCLTNCRCIIRFETVDDKARIASLLSRQRARATHIKRLQQIKRTR